MDNNKILIVDDDIIFSTIIKRKLQDKFKIYTASSGPQGLDVMEKQSPFAMVAVDYMMPEMNGIEFLDMAAKLYPETVRMMITAVSNTESIIEIINNINVFRFVTKPCSINILENIFQKGIEQYRLLLSEKKKNVEINLAYSQTIQYAKDLNETVSELKNKNMELNEAYYDTIQRLVLASEYKDEDTYDHILRMSRYSAFIASKMNFSQEEIQNILFASPMHDVGKIGIPDAIIMKPGKLTEDEFSQIKKHTLIGAKILEGSNAEILKLAATIAVSHHEKWNGTGYPEGFRGNEIPVVGRIVAIADTFDALTSKRPYKDAYPLDVAYDIMEKEKEKHFEPDILDIFIDNFNEITELKISVDTDSYDCDCSFKMSDRDK